MRLFPWQIEFKDEPFYSIWNGKETHGVGFYELTYNKMKYGVFGKDSLDGKSTEEILNFITNMLNDADNLAFNRAKSSESL